MKHDDKRTERIQDIKGWERKKYDKWRQRMKDFKWREKKQGKWMKESCTGVSQELLRAGQRDR